MYLEASEWAEHLRKKALRLELAHLDVLIDGTLFSESQRESLAALEPQPLQAWLFDRTTEHASRALGPLLVRRSARPDVPAPGAALSFEGVQPTRLLPDT